jgi:hypothetical protein
VSDPLPDSRDPLAREIQEALAAPFEPREVKFKPQQVKNNRSDGAARAAAARKPAMAAGSTTRSSRPRSIVGSCWLLDLSSGLRPDESYRWWFGDDDLDGRVNLAVGDWLAESQGGRVRTLELETCPFNLTGPANTPTTCVVPACCPLTLSWQPLATGIAGITEYVVEILDDQGTPAFTQTTTSSSVVVPSLPTPSFGFRQRYEWNVTATVDPSDPASAVVVSSNGDFTFCTSDPDINDDGTMMRRLEILDLAAEIRAESAYFARRLARLIALAEDLRAAGVDQAQGPFFGGPVEADRVPGIVAAAPIG